MNSIDTQPSENAIGDQLYRFASLATAERPSTAETAEIRRITRFFRNQVEDAVHQANEAGRRVKDLSEAGHWFPRRRRASSLARNHATQIVDEYVTAVGTLCNRLVEAAPFLAVARDRHLKVVRSPVTADELAAASGCFNDPEARADVLWLGAALEKAEREAVAYWKSMTVPDVLVMLGRWLGKRQGGGTT